MAIGPAVDAVEPGACRARRARDGRNLLSAQRPVRSLALLSGRRRRCRQRGVEWGLGRTLQRLFVVPTLGGWHTCRASCPMKGSVSAD